MCEGAFVILMVVSLATGGYAYATSDQDDWAETVAASAPPIPTPGYASTQEMIKAGQDGAFLWSQWDVPAPDGVIEKKDIEFCRNGDEPLTLDLFSLAGLDRPVPGIVFVHGGGWMSGSKEDIRHFAVACAKMGYVTATVNYRLSKGSPLSAQVQDVKCGVRWMRTYAAELNVAPKCIAICGASAGAHIALLAAYMPDVKESGNPGACHNTSSRVCAVMDVYGPSNLASPYWRNRDIVTHLVGDKTYDNDPKAFERASPLLYVTKDTPPTLILHGAADDMVPIEDSIQLAAKLNEYGIPCLYDWVDGWPHAMDFCTVVRKRCTHFMKAFLDRYLPLDKVDVNRGVTDEEKCSQPAL